MLEDFPVVAKERQGQVMHSLRYIGLHTLLVCGSVMLGFQIAYGNDYTWVDGRFYVPTTEDTNQFLGDLVVNFYEDKLPWGSKVEVHYGLGGKETDAQGNAHDISWAESNSVTAIPIGPYVWSAGIQRPLSQKFGARTYAKLQFYIEITQPNGESYRGTLCSPPECHLEAKMPWNEVPAVERNKADWRRLNLNSAHNH